MNGGHTFLYAKHYGPASQLETLGFWEWDKVHCYVWKDSRLVNVNHLSEEAEGSMCPARGGGGIILKTDVEMWVKP